MRVQSQGSSPFDMLIKTLNSRICDFPQRWEVSAPMTPPQVNLPPLLTELRATLLFMVYRLSERLWASGEDRIEGRYESSLHPLCIYHTTLLELVFSHSALKTMSSGFLWRSRQQTDEISGLCLSPVPISLTYFSRGQPLDLSLVSIVG